MHSRVPIRRILVALDFSETARQAFYAGIGTAACVGAEAWVLHVAEPVRVFDFKQRKFVETAASLERVERVLESRLDDMWVEGELRGIDRGDVHLEVRAGRAVSEILAAASEHEVDLIVLGATSWDDPDVRLGSTAAKVVRRASCSVMCVRAQPFEE